MAGTGFLYMIPYRNYVDFLPSETLGPSSHLFFSMETASEIREFGVLSLYIYDCGGATVADMIT